MSSDFESQVVEKGFKDLAEFHSMVAKVDLGLVGLANFRKWQYEDGTKEGLQKLLAAT